MGIHIFFIAIYAVLSNILSAEVICGIFIGHCLLCLFEGISRRERVHLMYVYYVGAIIGALANLSLIHSIHTYGLKPTSMYRYASPEHINDGIMLWTIGNSCIFFGYEVFRQYSLPKISIEIPRHTPRNTFYVILVLALLQVTGNLTFVRFLTGGAIILISLLTVIGIMFFARLWAVENNRQFRNYAFTLCLLQLWMALNNSYLRFDLLTPFFSLFAGYFIGKGSLKYVFSYRMVPAIAFLIVFALFFHRLGGTRAHFIDAFTEEVADDNQSYKYEEEGDEDNKGALFERSANIAQLSSVVRLTERNGLYGGTASAPILAAFVPRFLWPDKPQIQLGAWFAVEIGVARRDEFGRANNSINMTIPGNLYLDFGWLGLIVGCTLFGGFIAALWNAGSFHSSPYNLSGTIWGGYLMLYALAGMGADLQIVVSFISSYISFVLFKKLIQPALQRMEPRKLMARALRR